MLQQQFAPGQIGNHFGHCQLDALAFADIAFDGLRHGVEVPGKCPQFIVGLHSAARGVVAIQQGLGLTAYLLQWQQYSATAVNKYSDQPQ